MRYLQEKRQYFRELLDRPGTVVSDLTVAAIMTADPVSVTPETTALEIVELVRRHRFRHVLVQEHDGQLAGVISDRDLAYCFGGDQRPSDAELRAVLAMHLMSDDLVAVGPVTLIRDAAPLITENGINCLPVVTGGRAVGIFTTTDLYLLLEELLVPVEAAHSVHADLAGS